MFDKETYCILGLSAALWSTIAGCAWYSSQKGEDAPQTAAEAYRAAVDESLRYNHQHYSCLEAALSSEDTAECLWEAQQMHPVGYRLHVQQRKVESESYIPSHGIPSTEGGASL